MTSPFERSPISEPVEVRSRGGKIYITGTAIAYNTISLDLGGFRERILPGAATQAIKADDVLALDEHQVSRYLGRTGNGTLQLIDSPQALRYEVELPDTAIGREVATLAERRDYKGSSFGFRAAPSMIKWATGEDGVPVRTVTQLKTLRDVGPTTRPAYDATSAEMVLRSCPAEILRAHPALAHVHRRPATWFV